MLITRLIAMILSALNGIMISLMAYRFFHAYQLGGYRLGRLFAWYRNTNNKYMARLAIISFFSTGALIVTNVLFRAYAEGFFAYIGMVFHFLIGTLFAVYELKLPKKKPLVFTQRLTRLYIAFLILVTVTTYFMFVGSYELMIQNFGVDNGGIYMTLRYITVSVTPVAIPLFFTVIALIMRPFESLNNGKYMRRATDALARRKDVIKIGITGSYGKTSVKFILEKMLAQKYETLATPASYNTPMGIAKCASKLKPEHEVFIAEMGARNVGDIRTLVNMVRPQYVMLTGIAGQHLETFHTIENVIKTKSEILDGLPEDGMAVFNGDNELVRAIYEKCEASKIITATDGEEGVFAYADEITSGRNGSRFTLTVDGHSIRCATRLLGRHHISNIVLSAALAYKLGVDLGDIAQAVAELKPVPHRLELNVHSNGITVIDDSFNSNVEGTKAALDVLAMFHGRKAIVTPGMIELGITEREQNYEFGKRIASVCDVAVLIGKVRSEPIHMGLKDAGFDEKNIHVFASLHDARANFKNIFASGDTVLLENDLPDDYSEIDDK